jgi:hypothetical protein
MPILIGLGEAFRKSRDVNVPCLGVSSPGRMRVANEA